MPRRRTTPQRSLESLDLPAKLEIIRRSSPSFAELIEHWMDRALAGESDTVLDEEMNRLRAVLGIPISEGPVPRRWRPRKKSR